MSDPKTPEKAKEPAADTHEDQPGIGGKSKNAKWAFPKDDDKEFDNKTDSMLEESRKHFGALKEGESIKFPPKGEKYAEYIKTKDGYEVKIVGNFKWNEKQSVAENDWLESVIKKRHITKDNINDPKNADFKHYMERVAGAYKTFEAQEPKDALHDKNCERYKTALAACGMLDKAQGVAKDTGRGASAATQTEGISPKAPTDTKNQPGPLSPEILKKLEAGKGWAKARFEAEYEFLEAGKKADLGDSPLLKKSKEEFVANGVKAYETKVMKAINEARAGGMQDKALGEAIDKRRDELQKETIAIDEETHRIGKGKITGMTGGAEVKINEKMDESKKIFAELQKKLGNLGFAHVGDNGPAPSGPSGSPAKPVDKSVPTPPR